MQLNYVMVSKNVGPYTLMQVRYRNIPTDVAEFTCTELFSLDIFDEIMIVDEATDEEVMFWKKKNESK